MAKVAKPTKDTQTSSAKSGQKELPAYRTICENRKARHDYHVIETIETGIELVGTVVKSLRLGQANLRDAFARVEGCQLWLYSLHISPYTFGNRFNHDPLRKRRLLMHKQQILRLAQQTAEKGLTLVPLRLYFKRNLVKLDLALVRGKQLYDKRSSLSGRESKKELNKLVKQSYNKL